MAVDNKKVKEFEDKYKEVLFGKIGEISSQQCELISQIHDLGKYVDLERDLPNLGITLNNKLVELQHDFENAGISIYSQKVENYGPFKLNFVGSSFIGDAIISDLINYANKGTQNLTEYDKAMKKLTDKKVEKVQALEKTSPFRRFFAKIRNFFVPVKQEDLSYTQEEIDSVNTHLSDYRETDNQLWKYNLRDNVIYSIVREIREQGYSVKDVPGLLDESVIPDLQKLGLADLIPQLQQTLIEEYKKDLPDSEIYQVNEEDMYLYVPDFNRTTQDSETVNLEELRRKTEQTIEGEKRTLKEEGVSLDDIALVDKTVDASTRQAAANAIRQDIQPATEKNQDKDQENVGISIE